MAEKFDISIDRVKKIGVPLLVIGLGGTGCDALITVKKTFAERFVLPQDTQGRTKGAPARTAYLGIDSCNQAPSGLDSTEYLDISLPAMNTILHDQKNLLKEEERRWVNPKLNSTSAGIGMGTYRQAARLALVRNYGRVKSTVNAALGMITEIIHGAPMTQRDNRIEVVIISGIGGGTGSGLFLDIAQIVRKLASAKMAVHITGYIVMPDVSLSNVAGANGMDAPIKHNGYAALKELDFWQRVREHGTPYTMTYGSGADADNIAWNNPPFDACILMSGTNTQGYPFRDKYQTVRNTIAENVMHYMASGDGTATEYNYRQYEDNLAAIDVEQSYPLLYGYRTIGAFTKRVPKKSITYYEGVKLFETFIPMRDENNRLRPDTRMFTDGKTPERAKKVIGTFSAMMQDFRARICPLPQQCNMNLNDRAQLATYQQANPAPHADIRLQRWTQQNLKPAVLTAAEAYVDTAWLRFIEFAHAVMDDPKQGPFALQAYLEQQGDDSFMGQMKQIRSELENQRKKRQTGISQAKEACNNSLANFQRPPVLGGRRSLEIYDTAIKSLFTAVLQFEYLDAHITAVDRVIKRVNEYLNDGLRPMIATILKLEETFKTRELSDENLVQDLYPLSDVQNGIDDAFAKANENEELSRKLMKSLCDITLKTEKSVNTTSSGVQFLCKVCGLDALCFAITERLSEAFGEQNGKSLDKIMVEKVGSDITEQSGYMNELLNGVKAGAIPLFNQDTSFESDAVARFTYMSIPQNSPLHLTYAKTNFSTQNDGAQPTASYLNDHIYCLTAWDKLPLFRYNLMEEMRRQYIYDLDRDTGVGMHLVRSGDEDADFVSNWVKLPSPKPSFLFGQAAPAAEKIVEDDVHSLMERGLACGAIKVHDENSDARASFMLMKAGNQFMTDRAILDQVKAMDIDIDADIATQASDKLEEQAKKLKAYLEGASETKVAAVKVKASRMAPVLGLEGEPCDPWMSDIQQDPVALETAKKNHKQLCRLAIEVILYSRPDLQRNLTRQISAYEKINKRIQEIEKKTHGDVMAWDERTNYAKKAAQIFVFMRDAIKMPTTAWRYAVDGELFPIINNDELNEDLKDASEIVRHIGYLSDVEDANEVKEFFTKEAAKRKQTHEDDVYDGMAKAEDLEALIASAEKWKATASNEKTQLSAEYRKDITKKEYNRRCMAVLDAFLGTLEAQIKEYKRILDRM